MEPEEFIEYISSSNQSPKQILDYLKSEDVQEKYIKLAEDYFSKKQAETPEVKQQEILNETPSINSLTRSSFEIYDPNKSDVDEDFESSFIINNPNELGKIWNLGIAQGMIGRVIAKSETLGDLDENKLSYFNRVIRDNQPEKGDFLQSDKTVAGFALDVLRTVPQSLISIATAAPVGLAGAGVGAGTGAAYGSLVGPVGTAAGAGIGSLSGFAGASSLAIEYGSSMMSSLQEAGVDVYSPDAIEDAFKNPEKMEEARSYALKRGIPVAVFDAISGGTGGRIAGSIRKSARKSLGIGQALPSSVTAKAVLAEVGTQAGLGAAGEFSGQVVAGDEINPRDILLEGFAELAPATPSMINEYIKSKRGDAERGTFLEQSRSKVFNEINEENEKLDVKDRKTVEQIEEEVEDRMIASSEVYSIVLDGQEQLNDIEQSIEDNRITSKDDRASRKQKSLAEKLLQESIAKKDKIQKTIQQSFFSLPTYDQIRVQELFEESKELKAVDSKSNKKRFNKNKAEIQDIFKKQLDDSKKETGVSSPVQEEETIVEEQPVESPSVEETTTDRDVQEELTATQKIEESFRKKSIKEKELKELKSQRKNSLIENLGQEGVLDNKEGTIRIDSENENTIVFETEDEIIEIGKVKDEQGNDQIDLLSNIGITLTRPTKTQIEKASKKKEQENLQELKEFGEKKTQERQQQKIDIEEKSEKEIDALIEKADRDAKEYQQLVLDEVVSQEKNQDLVQVKEKVFQVTKKKDGSFAVSQMREDGKLVGIKDLTSREKAIKAFNKEKTSFEKKLLEDAQKSIDNYLAETEETLGESFNEVKEKRDSIIEFLDSAIKATSSQGRAFDATLGIPMFIANNSLKVVRSAYMAGKSLAEAIEAGINYIKKQGATVDKKDYENFVAENINQVKKKKLKKRSIKKKPPTKKQPTVETKKSVEELDDPISPEQKPLADEAKKQLDVEEKTIAKEEKSIKQRLREFFFWNEAQQKVIKLKESLSGRSTTENRKIKGMSSTLARLLKQEPSAALYVNKIFDGSITDQEQNELDALVLGKQISAQASFMRTYVDSLSKSIVNDPAFQSIPESTRSIIENNIGTYMRNSYKFFKDRKFNPSEAVKNDAIQYVYDQFLAQEMTILSLPEKDQKKIRRLFDEIGILKKNAKKAKKSTKLNEQIKEKRAAVQDILSSSEKNLNIKISQEEINSKVKDKLRKEAEEKIDNYLAEVEEIRSGEGFQLSGLARGSSIKLPNKQLKSKNKDLPETIQALLGIEKDPITRFSDTVTALSNIKYKGMFIYDTMRVADESMIKDEITAQEKKDNLYRQINDEYSPLNGKFVRSDLFEVISDEALYKSSNIGGQIYFDILKLSRKSKVIWNIPTWRKNLTGGWYTMMANGVINKRTLFDIQERSKALVGTAQGKDILNKETTEMLELMGEYGLLGSSVDANFAGLMDLTISSAIEGKPADGKIKTFLDKAGLSFNKFDKWSTENYSFVDDYTKLVIFRQEIPSMARKLYGKQVTDANGNYSKEKFDALTEDQKVETYRTAAEIVKESTPTFSRLPRFYKKLAKLPFGDFLGFELEAIRSMIGNVQNAASDIKKGTQDKNLDSVQRKAYLQAGLSRTFGVAALFALRIGIATGLASLFLGDDEDLDESAKALRPDWTAGHSLIITKITKEGNISMYDYSLEDPYGGVFDIITDPFGLPNHAWEMLGPNMAAELIFNLTKGKDVYGRDIAENTDNIFKKVLRYTSYGAKQTIIPPFASSYYRDYIKKGEAENAIDYFSGLVSRTTIRDYRYNANTQFYFNVKELATKKDFEELGFLDKKVRTKQLEEVKKQYEAIVNISLGKENYKMRSDAIKTIKRNFKGKERLYILYGYEL